MISSSSTCWRKARGLREQLAVRQEEQTQLYRELERSNSNLWHQQLWQLERELASLQHQPTSRETELSQISGRRGTSWPPTSRRWGKSQALRDGPPTGPETGSRPGPTDQLLQRLNSTTPP